MPLPPAETLLTAYPKMPLPAWARFDAAWYFARYAEARAYCHGDPAGALPYYLEIGVQLGHSPSPLFDEAFYLAQNPDVHQLVRGGTYRSGFDHFCQHGHRGLSPHWLFDDGLYGRLYEDMSLDNLEAHLFDGRYDHYLRSGQFERRTGHYIFDAGFYRLRAIEAGASESEIDALGPYTHFLSRPAGTEGRPSVYFDPGWYLENALGAAAAIADKKFFSGLEHYLCNETPELFDPVPQFSESYYRSAYADVARAIENGDYRNGYQHFVQFGAFELRWPRPDLDLLYYHDSHQRVRDDLRLGGIRDAFAHLRLIGLIENLSATPPDAMPAVSEPGARQIFLRKARGNLAVLARQKLDFAAAAPALSVVMVLFNKFELSMLALTSLRSNFSGGIELVLVDNGSTDETRRIASYVTGAKILRLEENLGFLRAANQALAFCTAPALLYLNNDVELGFAAVAAALARLDSDESIGAVCAKIIRTHGLLQEAGSIIWRDGSTSGYLRDAPSLAPAANFVRDVDYGSAVFLLCRTDLVRQLGGFDEDFSPSYFEDADLCLRMKQAGYRIVYDPSASVTHMEFGSADNSAAAMALMRRGRKIFAAKHAAYLPTRPAQDMSRELFARDAGPARRRVLFFEDTVPLRRLGSGFVRANDIVHAIAASCAVSVFPVNGAPYDIMSLFGDFPDTVEILHDLNINRLEGFLRDRAGFYDLAWISRTHNFARLQPILEAAGVTPETLPMVLDTEAVVTMREAARAVLTGEAKNFNAEATLRLEFAGTETCRKILGVSRWETGLIAALGLPASLLGTSREPALTAPPFRARAGLLFVGAIHREDSPNLDALAWYAQHIMPALSDEMDEPPILNVCGYIAPGIDVAAFGASPGIKLHGAADDLSPFYETNRVFIAPTRYAAGTPYKIYEAAAHGLPCVTTELLARQLGWVSGTDLLTAPAHDPRRFAAQIAMLYRTEAVWTKLRSHAAVRLANENSPEAFEARVADILDAVLGK